MFKYIVLFALVACAAAAPKPGYLAAPAAYHAAPLIAAPAVAVAPYSSQYHNTYKVSYKSPLLTPVVHAGPSIAYAAPAIAHGPAVLAHGYPAPLTYAAHAPLLAVH